MGDPTLFGDYDYKDDQSDGDDDDDGDGLAGTYNEYNQNGMQEDDMSFMQHNYEGDGMSEVPSSAYGVQYDRGRADVESEDGHDSSNKISEKDEHRLLGAFLLATDGGLDIGASRDRSEAQEPRLPAEAPACLKKFTTIAASLGLKTTREKLREDFEEVVRSNRLVRTSTADPWLGAHDTTRPIVGFTYKVFRRYYLAKIQGELVEANIRRAWEDLHHGTGGKLYHPGSSATDLGAIAVAVEASPASPRWSKGETRPNRQQRQQQHHQRRDSDDGRHGRPYILRAELQKILTTHGEALTDEEADELLRECRPDEEGRIVYEGYRRMLIDPSL
eukprot:g15409.t1